MPINENLYQPKSVYQEVKKDFEEELRLAEEMKNAINETIKIGGLSSQEYSPHLDNAIKELSVVVNKMNDEKTLEWFLSLYEKEAAENLKEGDLKTIKKGIEAEERFIGVYNEVLSNLFQYLETEDKNKH